MTGWLPICCEARPGQTNGQASFLATTGLTHMEVGIVALLRFAPRVAAQQVWKRGKSREKAVPTLHGSKVSQRENRYLTQSTQSLARHASALLYCRKTEIKKRIMSKIKTGRQCVALSSHIPSESFRSDCESAFDQLQQLRVALHRFKLRKLTLHILRRMDQETRVGFEQHAGIVIRITC